MTSAQRSGLGGGRNGAASRDPRDGSRARRDNKVETTQAEIGPVRAGQWLTNDWAGYLDGLAVEERASALSHGPSPPCL